MMYANALSGFYDVDADDARQQEEAQRKLVEEAATKPPRASCRTTA